ncbi:MAG TPA: M23 family metallopeptidase [Burkholderiaceae bacterium]|nr:M23 family metallopeptidase [Burkholderiaceae bacterium]
MKFAILLVVMLAFSAQAQVERRDHTIIPSRLSVAFPGDYACEPISSPFASPARYDGSMRRGDRNSGLHGGIDLSLSAGTPLLAIADGEVIALGEGGALEGIYIWLRHTPIDTGSPYFVFSKYQHLSALPTLKVGDRIKAGKVVGLSGATGTAGKHYGPSGYAHLHLSTFYGPSDEYEIKGMYGSMVSGKDARLDDPLILYLEGVQDLSAIRSLPDERKTVRPAVVGDDGRIRPEGYKTVWPVPCRELNKR